MEARTLFDLLDALHERRAEGELVVRERRGVVHRVILRAGRPVAAKVRGRFDPLLARLRDAGALDEHAHRRALGELARTERRAGEVARSLGAPSDEIARALAAQLRAALESLARRVDGTDVDYSFEPRRVASSEIVAWSTVPRREDLRARSTWRVSSEPRPKELGEATEERSKERPVVAPPSGPHDPRVHAPRAERNQARAARAARHEAMSQRRRAGLDRDTFRRLARALHPDRAHGLSEHEREENARALAELTARWHGLG